MESHKAMEEWTRWRAQPSLPVDVAEDLERIAGDEGEIEARFRESLDFGTGGLRGVMGAGLNRMNIYTVRRATAALALFIQSQGQAAMDAGVAVGYDCRHQSQRFAEVVGCTLAAYGIAAYISPVLCPTPELSFSVRYLKAAAGIMITASHNPPEYNGYKVYNRHGGQLLEDDATTIRNYMIQLDDVFAIPSMSRGDAETANLLRTIPAVVRATYVETVVHDIRDTRLLDHRNDLRIVYTPLHGTGHLPVRETLQLAGYKYVTILESQAMPDGNFSTVKSPNPEEPEALELAVAEALQSGADLVMGTDPDADRVGIAVRDGQGQMKLLTGNQVGALLVHYFCERGGFDSDHGRPIVFKTIVTSEFGAAIARAAGIDVEDTLTGFKYIGDRITAYEELGTRRLLVGYEESYGYLLSPIVRDKDAVQTCLAISEMAAFFKMNGLTLFDVLHQLYEQHGYFGEKLLSISLAGNDGVENMRRVLEALRQEPLQVANHTLRYVEDYLRGTRTFHDGRVERLTLPTSDVQKFVYASGDWAAFRPSGTEPKMKVYVGVRGKSPEDEAVRLAAFEAAIQDRVALS